MSGILKRNLGKSSTLGKRFFSAKKVEPIQSCFTWGQTGGDSSLGLNGLDDLAVPTEMPCPDNSGFIQVSHSQRHSAIVTGNGSLYMYGTSTHGQLGMGEAISKVKAGSSGTGSKFQANLYLETPTKIDALSHEKIVRAACGSNHSAAVTEDGALYTWGWGGQAWGFSTGGLGHGNKTSISIPQKVEALSDVFIVDVACGDSHTLATDSTGRLWAFGAGEYGRLGIGRSTDQKSPVASEFFEGTNEDILITKALASSQFSMALVTDGSLYGWGRNDRQQLGLSGGLVMDVYSSENFPELLGIESSVIDFACCPTDCVALTDDGEVLAWGDRQFIEPTPITGLFPAEKVAIGFELCGLATGYHAFVCKDGTLWTANKKVGLGSSGTNCLGQGFVDPYREPRMVEALQGRFVKQLACQDTKISVLVD